jgi:hypothetical protein
MNAARKERLRKIPMEKDVLQVLTEEHAVLVWLADRVDSATRTRARTVLFNELSRALGAHGTVIDQTIMPALKACGWNGVSSDVLTGHLALKRLLAEALTLEREPGGFEEVVRRLVPRVKAQCDLEQRKLLPVLQRCVDEGQRAMMALDAELHLTRLLGESPKFLEDSGFGLDAEGLVEQAYVVLGSLPARKGRALQH